MVKQLPSRGCVLLSYFRYFLMLDEGFSLKPKHVQSNKTDINLVVIRGLYLLFNPKCIYCYGARDC